MRRASAMLSIAAGCLLSLGPSAPVANAGSYQVTACNEAPEGANNAWIWVAVGVSGPAPLAEHAMCPYRGVSLGANADREGGLSTTDTLGLSSGVVPGTTAGWGFVAPQGTLITALSYERLIGHQLDPFNDWVPGLRVDGALAASETCTDTPQNGETCTVGAPPGQAPPATLAGLSAHQVVVGVDCEAPAGDECVTGASQHQVWAAMYGATVTLSDPTPPALQSPPAPLWDPSAAGSVHQGTESLTVSAQDVGGGVQKIELVADGQTMASYSAPCDFTHAQPCPSGTGAQSLTLSTTKLPNGLHTVTLAATDAAGNESSASERIVVQNITAPAPPTVVGGAQETTPGIVNRPTAPIRLTEALRGRVLVVVVSAPARGTVRVRFSGSLRGRAVAMGARTLTLKRGRARTEFRLGPRTAARARIRVTARLGHQPAVSSTLRRSRR